MAEKTIRVCDNCDGPMSKAKEIVVVNFGEGTDNPEARQLEYDKISCARKGLQAEKVRQGLVRQALIEASAALAKDAADKAKKK